MVDESDNPVNDSSFVVADSDSDSARVRKRRKGHTEAKAVVKKAKVSVRAVYHHQILHS